MQQARNTPRLDLWLSRAGAFVCAVAFSAPARALPEGPTDVDRPVTDSKSSRAERERWMATLEGYTRAPVDLGIALGLELPFGLRLSTSLGWVPPAYMGLITSTIASTTGDARAEAFLENASYEGRSWSAQVGYRPFSRYGVYVDAGYSKLTLNGTGVIASGMAGLAGAEGRYEAHTSIDLWSLVLGYELEPVDRLVLGAGVGALGTLSAHTSATSTNPRASNALLADAAARFDRGLNSYGVVPTLTLRAGFDFY
jgi:hypothetical protein